MDPSASVDPVRGIKLRNELAEPTFATVVVEDGDRTRYAESDTVAPGELWHHEGLVARPGIYRVIVETEAGDRAVHGWLVGEGREDRSLIARLTADGVQTSQVSTCAPECPPLPARGRSVRLPRSDPADPGLEVSGALVLRNAGTERAPVSLRVADDGRRLIDYTDELPPGVRVIVPVARRVRHRGRRRGSTGRANVARSRGTVPPPPAGRRGCCDRLSGR